MVVHFAAYSVFVPLSASLDEITRMLRERV